MAQDFRSWLAGKDKYALDYTGNDGRIDMGKVNGRGADTAVMSYAPGQAGTVQNYISGLYSQYNNEKGAAADMANTQWMQGLNAQIAALRAQTAAMPKLPSFDILGNYNRAKQQAEASQRPLYDKMLNTFLQGQGVKRDTKQKETALTKENIAKDRAYTLEDNALNRNRTAEDFVSAIAQIGQNEQNFQTDEGTQFDVDRRVLQEGVAGSGLTTSGLGQNAIGTQQDQRNITSERQVQEFDNQRAAKQLFKDRTFADLETGDLRAEEKAVLANKGADFDLESYLNELAQGETEYRQKWEIDLGNAIIEATGDYENKGVAEFINSLIGSGARAQDIALAKQVYGS